MTASVSSGWPEHPRRTIRQSGHAAEAKLVLLDEERPGTPVAPLVGDWSLVLLVALVFVVLASFVII